MTETDAIQLFKCLADKSRLQILKSLAIEDMYVERLAERLGITPSTVSFHLKKLTEAGAVTSHKSQYYMMYSLRRDIFDTTILKIIQEEIPSLQTLNALMQTIEAPKTLGQIGVEEALLPTIFRATKDIRDKYVLSRLAWDLGIEELLI